ncbi:MAG: alpha/beta fold hydrolase [Paludibacteraceae bacterium]|nr:alpha/beta fold hydrolase [Paludibacteraceae bacterium]
MRQTIYFIALFAALALTACTNQNDETAFSMGGATYVQGHSDTLYIQGAVGRLETIVDNPEIIGQMPCRVAIVTHGFQGTKDSSLHRMLADTLLHAGFTVIRFDFNGQGGSDGEFKDMTVPKEMEDLRCVYRWVRKTFDYAQDYTLIGHSLSGAEVPILAAELGKDSIQNVVMLAPAPSVRNMILSGKFWGAEFDSHNPPKEMAVWNNSVLGGEFITTLRDMPLFELAMPYKGRMCIIHGDDDWLIPYTDAETYHLLLPQSEYHKLSNCEHLFYGHYNDVAEIVVKFLNSEN